MNSKKKIEGLPFLFIFNLDELGEQQFADALGKSVIVPLIENKRPDRAPQGRKRSQILGTRRLPRILLVRLAIRFRARVQRHAGCDQAGKLLFFSLSSFKRNATRLCITISMTQ